jgi:hypothetical protein
MTESLSHEITRRQSNTEKVLAYFIAHAKEWIDWHVFAELVGVRAYRTRVSDARKIVEKAGGKIETRDKRGVTGVDREPDGMPVRLYLGFTTQYRYLPYVPLARPADVQPPDQPALFEMGGR